MAKWNVTLSTTEPHNYVGMIQVRQGNKGTETIKVWIVENGVPYNLTQCKVYIEAYINGYTVQRGCEIIDAENGVITYTFDEYTMQALHKQTANIRIFKGEDLIGTTQDFSYFVIKAVSKNELEAGSYWQTVEDLIADMTAFINAGKGDFNDWMNARKEEFDTWRKNQQDTFEDWRNGKEADYNEWFDSIRSILESIDPGGVLLKEVLDARVDLQGVRHSSIGDRLLADFEYLYQKIQRSLFTIDCGEIEYLTILQDDKFSLNHEVELVGTVDTHLEDGALVIATIDDVTQNAFTFEKVGEV